MDGATVHPGATAPLQPILTLSHARARGPGRAIRQPHDEVNFISPSGVRRRRQVAARAPEAGGAKADRVSAGSIRAGSLDRESARPPHRGGATSSDAERLQLALLAGGLGWWEWNLPDDEIVWSPEIERMH